MAALCPGVQYGLSSQQTFGANKDLIFVKLTDSALRAIEEYIRNQGKLSFQSPTIKFLGDENGELSFPSVHHEGSSTSFSFSMSSTADMEGPAGSFECLQQIGVGGPRGGAGGCLECLGSIPNKIRIHANEDVYEVTRNRMTEAEDKYKNKCTREIKPNQNDIGRKVKVKQLLGQAVPRPLPPTVAVTPPAPTKPSMRESLLKQPSSYQMPPASNANSKAVLHSTTPISSAAPLSNGLLSNGLGSNLVTSSRPQLNNKPSVPDIARKPLKERLIHLLALRPFKKVELYERLMREGLREKNGMTSVLKQISLLKGNCFHLNRSMWNEVQEDWPFYTESEKQILKRRKPENLTPPGGSDGGSSGSGQSPTSTHPGSPPPQISSTNKRPGFFDGADGFPTKRQRVSHYKKPSPTLSVENTNNPRKPITDSRDASNMNPRSREMGAEPPVKQRPMVVVTTSLSGDEEEAPPPPIVINNNNTTLNKKRACDSHSLSYGGRSSNGGPKGAGASPKMEGVPMPPQPMAASPRSKDKYHKVTSSTQTNRIARVSPDSQTDNIPEAAPPPAAPPPPPPEQFPDYLTQYVTIRDPEQRRRYKEDFNADYAEYKDLHGVVEKVSRRFAQLEARYKKERDTSPKYKKDLMKQIVKEYQENKKDLEHQKAKQRFQYLHEKLSHIKRLVLEYDQEMTDGQY